MSGSIKNDREKLESILELRDSLDLGKKIALSIKSKTPDSKKTISYSFFSEKDLIMKSGRALEIVVSSTENNNNELLHCLFKRLD